MIFERPLFDGGGDERNLGNLPVGSRESPTYAS